MKTSPLVDIIIAVHNGDRPVERAVGSVLDHNSCPILVTVVAHNVDASVIRKRLVKYINDPRLRLLELHDGIHSPAGPKNLGLENGAAPFFSLLDSDDEFEAGAIDAWLSDVYRFALNKKTGADVVVAVRKRVPGRYLSHPLVRCGRKRNLKGAEDRLAYRSGITGGLIKRQKYGHLRFKENMPVGEDLYFSSSLWFGGGDIVFASSSPAYLEHNDQIDRVTSSLIPAEIEFLYLDELLLQSQPWMCDHKARLSWSLKMFRVHVLGRLRTMPGALKDPAMGTVFSKILNVEPRVTQFLSLNELRLLSSSDYFERIKNKKYFLFKGPLKLFGELIPGNILNFFHALGPLRFRLAQTALQLRLLIEPKLRKEKNKYK